MSNFPHDRKKKIEMEEIRKREKAGVENVNPKNIFLVWYTGCPAPWARFFLSERMARIRAVENDPSQPYLVVKAIINYKHPILKISSK